MSKPNYLQKVERDLGRGCIRYSERKAIPIKKDVDMNVQQAVEILRNVRLDVLELPVSVILAEVEQLQDKLRASAGGCWWISKGDSCNCGLCKRDKEIDAKILTAEKAAIKEEQADGP